MAWCWISTPTTTNPPCVFRSDLGAGEWFFSAGEIHSKITQNDVISKMSFQRCFPKRCFQTGKWKILRFWLQSEFLQLFPWNRREKVTTRSPLKKWQVSSEALGFPNHGVPKAQNQGPDAQISVSICVDEWDQRNLKNWYMGVPPKIMGKSTKSSHFNRVFQFF